MSFLLSSHLHSASKNSSKLSFKCFCHFMVLGKLISTVILCTHLSLQILERQFPATSILWRIQEKLLILSLFSYFLVVKMGVIPSKLFTYQSWNQNNSKIFHMENGRSSIFLHGLWKENVYYSVLHVIVARWLLISEFITLHVTELKSLHLFNYMLLLSPVFLILHLGT